MLKWEVWTCSSEKRDLTLMKEQRAQTAHSPAHLQVLHACKGENSQTVFRGNILSLLYSRLGALLGWPRIGQRSEALAVCPARCGVTEESGSVAASVGHSDMLPCGTPQETVSRCLLLHACKDWEVTGAFSILAFQSIAKNLL